MTELKEHFFERDGEQLRTFYMFEIEVDGIFGSYINKEDGYRRIVSSPMFHFKEDDDPTPSMFWTARIEIDEELWLREGRIVQKKS